MRQEQVLQRSIRMQIAEHSAESMCGVRSDCRSLRSGVLCAMWHVA